MRRSGSWFQGLLLWGCTFGGGILTGCGLFLLVQLEVLRHVRDQVADLNFLERFLGKMTFLWRGVDEKLVLALADIPEEYLEHSETAGRWMMALGLVGVALVLPWRLRRRWDR